MCLECGHIGSLADGQVFARCGYWSESPSASMVPDEWRGDEYAYMCLHCHVAPEQPACPAAVERERCCA